VVADAEDARRAAVLDALAQGRPVYLLRPLAGLLAVQSDRSSLAVDAVGPLLRVRTAAMPLAPEPPALQAAVAMTPEIDIAAAASWPTPVHQGRLQRMGLVWQVHAPPTAAMQVSARLLDASGRVVAQYDAEPVHRMRPTTTWRAGERIVDVYDLPLPPHAQGPFTPLLILYRMADGQELGRLTLPAFD